MDNIIPFAQPEIIPAYLADPEECQTVWDLAEQTVIQCLLAFPNCLDKFEISYEFFQIKPLRDIYNMICELKIKDAPIDEKYIKALYHEKFLSSAFAKWFDGVWRYRPIKLIGHLNTYVDVLAQRHLKCKFENLRDINRPNVPVVSQIQSFVKEAQKLVIENTPEQNVSFNDDWMQVLSIADDAANGVVPHKLLTHYASLDALLGEGILDDYLVILGAESGAGKTTLALNLIRNIALNQRHSSLYMSFEMGRTRLMRWFMACCSKIPMANFLNGKITEQDHRVLEKIRSQELCENPLIIVETKPELANVLLSIKTAVDRNPNCRLIVLDHLHLMSWSKAQNAVDAISEITKSLKYLAMELQIPILLLSQLKKPETPPAGIKVEARAPHISLLKGSGSIATDADLVMMLQLDPVNVFLEGTRCVKNYVLKNRGGAADGNYITFAHIKNCCQMVTT